MVPGGAPPAEGGAIAGGAVHDTSWVAAFHQYEAPDEASCTCCQAPAAAMAVGALGEAAAAGGGAPTSPRWASFAAKAGGSAASAGGAALGAAALVALLGGAVQETSFVVGFHQ